MQPDLKVRSISEDDVRGALTELVTSLVNDMPAQQLVHVTRCAVLGEPVVRPLASRLADYYKHGLESETQKRRTVILDEEFADKASASTDYMVDRLFEELGPQLCAGRFSFEKGNYRPFDDYELDFILGTLGR